MGLAYQLLGEEPQPNDPCLLMTHVVPVTAWTIAALLLAAALRSLVRLRSHVGPAAAPGGVRGWARTLLPAAALLTLGAGLLAAPLGLASHFYPDAVWATVIAYTAIGWAGVRLLAAAMAARRLGRAPPPCRRTNRRSRCIPSRYPG
jgi:hypothetical protein